MIGTAIIIITKIKTMGDNENDGCGCLWIIFLIIFIAALCSRLDKLETKVDALKRKSGVVVPI